MRDKQCPSPSLEPWTNWFYINRGKGSNWSIKRGTDVSLISQLPVECAWAIITMVTKDLGRQSLFIPVHSFTPLFSHIQSGKNIKLPAHQCCAFCLWATASSSCPFCFHAYPPGPSLPAVKRELGFHLLCVVICWVPFTLRDPCVRVGKDTVRSRFMVPVLWPWCKYA